MLFLLLGLVVKAQEDITLFRFISKKEVSGKVYAVSPFFKESLIQAKELSSKTFDLETGYLDAFILIPHPDLNAGTFFIASAIDKTVYLRPDSFSKKILLRDYNNDPSLSKPIFYAWTMSYAGSKDEVYLEPFLKNNEGEVLTFENGSFILKGIEDTKGVAIRENDRVSSGERISDKQIIIIQRLKNSL